MQFPKKSLGQNYLTDDNISRNIVNSFNIKKGDNVIEIGAGQGSLTKYLLQKTDYLAVIEVDKNNCGILKQKFPRLDIINEDFLKINFDALPLKHKFRVIGNIPYNISSPIIFKLIDNREIISDAQLMVQEEFAKRLTAKPNSKDYGIPSVFVQVFSKPELLFKVSHNCFYPKPKVDSRIVYFDFSNSQVHRIINIEFFRKFVKAAFSTRRKMLKNTLKTLNIDLKAADFDFSRRAENLTVNEFIELSNSLCSTK